MHSTLNHSTSRTFVSWNMVMVLTFLVDQWNMKRISCDPRGAGHRAQLQAKKVVVPLMCLLVVNQVAHGILESGIIQLESGICHHFLSF
ncbi:hypothetical protein POPTR_003G081133v4 [Populus trichocarpa]|uniref:Uncharacterized protein n=1 Tax=Populus trichocarpa TaxID=3694 RepID=A0ACC0T8T5_POPTR|nr:hypothetical protein POPTR_003G081133v4 [Populus trichocarpa]